VNKSKRIKKVEVEVKVHDKSKDRIVSAKILTIASAIFVLILVGALIFDQLYTSTILKVDGKNYSLKDLSYYFYTVEYQYNYYDQMFGGNGTYWDMSADASGKTIRDTAKQEAIDTALYTEVLYKEAVSEGYALTDEETTKVGEDADNMLKNLSAESIANGHFTKENLIASLSKTNLVSRYRQDKVDALNIDDAGITAGISRDQYRQYDVEYLFASKTTTDADGKSIEMTADEKAKAKDALTTYYDKAKTTDDWSKLLPEDEKLVSYRSDNFIESDTTFDDTFKAKIMTMENGAISEIYEADNGYYVLKMVNNNSSESYDKAVKDAISKAENEEFNKVYEEILAKHTYKINQAALKPLTMGSIVLGSK